LIGLIDRVPALRKALAASAGATANKSPRGGNFLEILDFVLFGIYSAPIGKSFFATGNIAKQGNVRTQTLRAFTIDEMKKILEKVA